MEIIYLVRSRASEEMEAYAPLAREQSRLGYEVRIYPWLRLNNLAGLFGPKPPAVLHLVGFPLLHLKGLIALKSALSFTLVLEAPANQDPAWQKNLTARATRRWLLPLLSQGVNGFVARSRSERRWFEKELGVKSSKILCLSPGIDAAHFQFRPEGRKRFRERLGLSPWETLCLPVGGLHSRAEVKEILWAGRSLFRDGRAWLAVAGGSPKVLQTLLENQARKMGVLPRVKWLEEIPSADLPELYSAADLGIRLERDLAAGLAAMACGLPLAPPADGVLAWWREEKPRFFLWRPPAAELGQLVKRLLQEPASRRELSERGRRFIESECDWPAQARRLCGWYREMAGAGAVEETGETRERLAA